MRLEHFDNHSLVEFISEIATNMNDYGTEKHIARVQPIPCVEVLPYFTDTIATDIATILPLIGKELQQPEAGVHPMPMDDHANDPDVFEHADVLNHEHDDVDVELFEHGDGGVDLNEDDGVEFEHEHGAVDWGSDDNAEFDFTHFIETPPIHHINQAAVKSLSLVMPSFDAHVQQAKKVCKIVRSSQHKPRLLSTCFSSNVGLHLQPLIRRFRGHIHEERWGTWAASVPQLLGFRSFYKFICIPPLTPNTHTYIYIYIYISRASPPAAGPHLKALILVARWLQVGVPGYILAPKWGGWR